MTSNVQNPNTASISYTSPELKNLPTTVLSGNTSSPVHYRAVEASAVIEGATVLRTGSAGAVTMGTFGVSEASVSKGAPVTATATTTTNALPMKQLDITKVWDDETNRDGVRPSTLTFDVTRTKCNTDTDKATASVVVGWEKNGVEGEPNTWKKSMFVPVYWNPNTTTPSEYAISESLDADKFVNVDKYPTRWVSIDGTTWTEVTNTPPTTPTVDLSSTGSAAFFKNSRAHDVTTITASKEWAAFDSKADMGSLVDLSGTSYRPATLTFELQYSVDGGTTWFAVDATGEDGSPKPENPKTSGGLAIDAKITPTVNADGTLTTNPAWSDLPKYQNNDTVDDSESYQYRVMESSLAEGVSQTPAFTVSYAPPSLNGKDITADSNPVTVTNTFKTTSFTATKTWDDSSNLYETRPDAVKFTLQYSVDQGTNWINVPDAGIWANKATFNMTNPATDTGTWTATVDMLPECAVDGTAYKYRAVETALIYGVG
ncbi:MAG: Cna B-type domain-containing protein, partial [Bacteroides sp.]